MLLPAMLDVGVNGMTDFLLLPEVIGGEVFQVDERKLPEILQNRVDLYLRCARPALLRLARAWPSQKNDEETHQPTGALWIDSNLGRPMSYSGVEEAVAEATRQIFGFALRPHMFRSCAATNAYVMAGDNPNLACALLQHTDQRVTQKHYNKATNAQAAMMYASLIDEISSKSSV